MVLAYNTAPQWSSRTQRDSRPNPQDILLASMGVSTLALLVAVAIRAGHVLTRKMAPLVAAADAVAASDLDAPVGTSNVAQVDDALAAMERTRVSLRDWLEARWAAEEDRRRYMESLMHELKMSLAVIQDNAELLEGDLAAGRLSGDRRRTRGKSPTPRTAWTRASSASLGPGASLTASESLGVAFVLLARRGGRPTREGRARSRFLAPGLSAAARTSPIEYHYYL